MNLPILTPIRALHAIALFLQGAFLEGNKMVGLCPELRKDEDIQRVLRFCQRAIRAEERKGRK